MAKINISGRKFEYRGSYCDARNSLQECCKSAEDAGLAAQKSWFKDNQVALNAAEQELDSTEVFACYCSAAAKGDEAYESALLDLLRKKEGWTEVKSFGLFSRPLTLEVPRRKSRCV